MKHLVKLGLVDELRRYEPRNFTDEEKCAMCSPAATELGGPPTMVSNQFFNELYKREQGRQMCAAAGLSLPTPIYPCLPLPAPTCLYLPLPTPAYPYLPLPSPALLYLPLPTLACLYLPLFTSAPNSPYIPVPAPAIPYLPLPTPTYPQAAHILCRWTPTSTTRKMSSHMPNH